MSIFRVKLTNAVQGHIAGANQRSVYIMGPNKINRVLYDGETFEDTNFWKRYAYPQTSLENAFLEVVEDDGVQYIDNQQTNFPKVYNLTASAESDFEDNKTDILGDTGGYAVFAQITNENTDEYVLLRLNGDDDAVLRLPKGSTQSFQAGDVSISTIEVKNESLTDVDVQILLSVAVISKS